jgi:hypothetical protein
MFALSDALESAAAAVSGCSVWLACCAVGLVAALLLQLLAPDVPAAPFCRFCSFLHSCLCCGHALRWQAWLQYQACLQREQRCSSSSFSGTLWQKPHPWPTSSAPTAVALVLAASGLLSGEASLATAAVLLKPLGALLSWLEPLAASFCLALASAAAAAACCCCCSCSSASCAHEQHVT